MPSPALALVTGATSGIGMALCHILAQQGVSLILTGRNETVLHQLQQQLSIWVNVEILTVDLSKKTERHRLVARIRQVAPDLVINNAGFGLYGEALTYSTDDQLGIAEVDALAVLELTLEAARTLISKDKKGIILNVSSAAGFQIMPNFAVYAAAKSFVNRISEALDEEMKPYGVRVLVTCPGMVDTAFQARAGGEINPLDKQIRTMTPEFVAKQIWQQIVKQKRVLILDWKYRLMTYLSYLLPKQIVMKMIKKNIAKRIRSKEMIKINS